MGKQDEIEELLPEYSERSRSGKPRPEPVIDPERVALENTVRVADSTIRALEKRSDKTREEYDKLEHEFEEAKLSQRKETLYYTVEVDRLRKKNNVTEARALALQEDMQDAGASTEYATLIVEPPSDKNDREKAKTYVLKLQKQVIEAVENMQAAPKKLTNLLDNFDEAVTRLRAQLMDLMDEQSRTEMQLVRQRNNLQEEFDDMEEIYGEQIQDSKEKLEMFKAKWDKAQTFEDLEEELEEADAKLGELQELRDAHAKQIHQLETRNNGVV